MEASQCRRLHARTDVGQARPGASNDVLRLQPLHAAAVQTAIVDLVVVALGEELEAVGGLGNKSVSRSRVQSGAQTRRRGDRLCSACPTATVAAARARS